jgi:membrane fusion protein, multidrug efflux system
MPTMIEEPEVMEQHEEAFETVAAVPHETTRETKRPRRRTRTLAIIGGAVVLIAATVTGAYAWLGGSVSTDDAQVDGHIVTISPKVGGHVVDVLVNDNQPVKAGDVIVRIDDRDFRAKVDQARAAVLQAESAAKSAGATVPLTQDTTSSATSYASAQLSAAEADLVRAQAAADQASVSDLAYAETNVASKQASNDRAQADLARMKPLAAKAEISQQQYDSYVAAARVADSDLRGAQERLASARKQAEIEQAAVLAANAKVEQARAAVAQSVASQQQVVVRRADLGDALAQVEAAEANLAAAELQLSYTEVKAPIDGVVTRKTVEPGQFVQPGQGMLVIVPLQDVWVTANFKETQLAGVRAGQTAEVKVDMYGRKLTGRVDSISGATGSRLSLLPPENATGNYVKVVQRIPVKILLNAADLQQYPLRVGMNVEATIETR